MTDKQKTRFGGVAFFFFSLAFMAIHRSYFVDKGSYYSAVLLLAPLGIMTSIFLVIEAPRLPIKFKELSLRQKFINITCTITGIVWGIWDWATIEGFL